MYIKKIRSEMHLHTHSHKTFKLTKQPINFHSVADKNNYIRHFLFDLDVLAVMLTGTIYVLLRNAIRPRKRYYIVQTVAAMVSNIFPSTSFCHYKSISQPSAFDNIHVCLFIFQVSCVYMLFLSNVYHK